MEKSNLPLDTASLQKLCYYRHGINSNETMRISQKLYEKGFITYMRTTSRKITSSQFLKEMSEVIKKKFGAEFVNLPTNHVQTTDAHECIRPTSGSVSNKVNRLNDKEQRIFRTIYDSTITSCMKPSVYTDYSIEIESSVLKRRVQNVFSEMCFSGYKAYYYNNENNSDSLLKKDKVSKIISQDPKSLVLESLTLIEDFKTNDSLYNEASIINFMKKNNIGRPSTYSYIINHIQKKGYVSKKNTVKGVYLNHCNIEYKVQENKATETFSKKYVLEEKDKFSITDKGKQIIKYMQTFFPKFVDICYTSSMEENLDKILYQNFDYNEIVRECDEYIKDKSQHAKILKKML